jgi:MHS family shikimate/dehydroshikimate transporter-like MFS transporter
MTRSRFDTRTLVILACSATAGVLLEFYDFTVFGYAAASAFPQVFFPNLAPAQALVFSYLTYGAGYAARLVGAFIFGRFGDRTSRKFAFLINIVIVGASTCLTGLAPGYAKLGISAPILLLSLRIIRESESEANSAAHLRCSPNLPQGADTGPSECRWPTLGSHLG